MSVSRLSSRWQHLLCFLLIFLSYLPIAVQYYQHFPPSGFDFYQMPAYEAYLRENPGFLPGLWKNTWFCGVSLSRDYAVLHMYLALPFAFFLGDVAGCRIYLLFTLYVFAVFSYLLFFKLSKSKIVALALANGLIWSPNVYSVFFNGLFTFAATQMFLPMSLFLLAEYHESQNKRWLFLSSAVAGLSVLGHQAAGGLLVFIPSLIVVLFWTEARFSKRFWMYLGYVLVAVLIFIPAFAVYNYDFLNLSQILLRITRENPVQYASTQAPQAWNFLLTTNFLLYVIFAAALVYVIAKRNPDKVIQRAAPFLVILVFLVVFQSLFFLGYNPVKTFIQPHRIFWLFPLVLASITSTWCSNVFKPPRYPIYLKKTSFSGSSLVRTIMLGFLFILLVFTPFAVGASMRRYFDVNCADPPLINEVLVNDEEHLLQEIVPSWVDTSKTDYRVYNHNPSLSIWWNILFTMPVTHGYFQALTPDQNYWKSWLDAALTGSLGVGGKHQSSIVENQSLFLIDWFAIRYLVGGRTADSRLASYLNESFIRADYIQGLLYTEVAENLAAPIVEATNAPTVLIMSNNDWYRNILRNLFASVNLNSRHYVPIRGPEYIDDLSYNELTNFDCVYLYTYRYRSFDKAFELLDNYVANGGNLIVDTGFETPESDSTLLPNFFPINETVRSPLGEKWNFTASNSSITQGITFTDFDPPIFEDGPWTMSFAPSDKAVKPEASVVLRNWGHPVVAVWNYGEGRVTWSGLNLPYHVTYYKNLEEIIFHKNLLNWTVQSQSGNAVSFTATHPRSGEVTVEGHSGFKGVLFKENAFGGWAARVTSNVAVHKLKIYHAGPDFMYIRVPSGVEAPFTVRFSYVGLSVDWFFFALSSATLFVTLDYSLLKGRISVNRIRKLSKRSA